MKRFAYYIACCTLVALCACTHDDTDDVIPVGNGKITIQASLDDMAITRATVEDTQAERKITHIDVFAVDENDKIAYYERNDAGNNDGANVDGSGVLTLNVARRAKINDTFVFAQGEEYKFYLVANATATKTEMGAIKTLAALQQLIQDDSFIPNTDWASGEQTLLHLTGTTDLGTNPDKEVPETFLMDAVATDAQSNDAWVVNPTDGNLTNLNLSAEFKRAAAKIIVNITQGDDVEFHTKMKDTTGTEEKSQYDFIMLPASTFVLPSDEPLVGVKLVNTNPMGPNNQTFVWTSKEPAASNSIQVVGYTYAHFWDNANLKNETSLILNIPMMWNKDDSTANGKEAAAPRSWYKVPLSKDKKFERNTCYVVNVAINAVGAANRSTAIELDDIEYKTLDWDAVDINVGDDENRPAYLELNTDLVEIYNANFDNTSLSFSSSSAITSVTLKDVYKQNADGTFTSENDNYGAYYINKFGIKTSLSETIKAMISATAQPDVLNGNIAILSPIVNTTEAEREKALAALGDEPKEPAVVAAPSGMPEPALPSSTSSSDDDYEWVDGNMRNVTTTTTTSYSYKGVGENIKFYKTTTVNKTYRDWGGTTNVDGYPQTTTEEYVNDTIKQNYITAYNTWVANNADKVVAYLKYLEEKARYDAYYTAKAAIEKSGSAGDTHYNTIRYLEFEVTNEQGLTATFRVMQYPLVYIVNIEGYYSYRSDFIATDGTIVHFQNRKANYLTQAYWAEYKIQRRNNSNNWTDVSNSSGYDSVYGDQQNDTRYADGHTLTAGNSGYYYTYTENGTEYRKFYSDLDDVYDSDVRRGKAFGEDNDNPGRSDLDTYKINSNKNSWTYSDSKNPGNHRMYHVRITSSSGDYIVGRPRLIDDEGKYTDNAEIGHTSDDANNANLVSPSFMLASQLGVTSSVTLSTSDGVVDDWQYQRAVDQCKNYVETTYDDTNNNGVWDEGETVHHYNDWRLPTSAEIAIISKLQNNSVAVDEVLAGRYYFCASPTRYANGKSSGTSGGFIRCIRDAY